MPPPARARARCLDVGLRCLIRASLWPEAASIADQHGEAATSINGMRVGSYRNRVWHTDNGGYNLRCRDPAYGTRWPDRTLLRRMRHMEPDELSGRTTGRRGYIGLFC